LKDNKRHGYGHIKFKDSSIIFGEWMEDKELGGNLHKGGKKKNKKVIH